MEKVLVFCPTKDLFGRCLQSICNLRWPGGIYKLFSRDNPMGSDKGNVIYNYIQGREMFLAGDYEALLTVESDMILPADALIRLARVVEDGADVAYGLYCWRTGTHAWTAYTDSNERGVAARPVSEMPELAREWWGTVRVVTGLGFGCTLLRREVVEMLELDVEDELLPDSTLSRIAQERGLVQMCDLGVVCGHIRRDPALVVWPDPEEEGLCRVEML